MSYSKKKLPKSNDEIDVVDCIRQMRGKYKFPDDGGYSGALIMEKYDVGVYFGKNNEKYSEVYSRALSDMPDAFRIIEKEQK